MSCEKEEGHEVEGKEGTKKQQPLGNGRTETEESYPFVKVFDKVVKLLDFFEDGHLERVHTHSDILVHVNNQLGGVLVHDEVRKHLSLVLCPHFPAACEQAHINHKEEADVSKEKHVRLGCTAYNTVPTETTEMKRREAGRKHGGYLLKPVRRIRSRSHSMSSGSTYTLLAFMDGGEISGRSSFSFSPWEDTSSLGGAMVG